MFPLTGILLLCVVYEVYVEGLTCVHYFSAALSLLPAAMLLSTKVVCCFGHYGRHRMTNDGVCNPKVCNLLF